MELTSGHCNGDRHWYDKQQSNLWRHDSSAPHLDSLYQLVIFSHRQKRDFVQITICTNTDTCLSTARPKLSTHWGRDRCRCFKWTTSFLMIHYMVMSWEIFTWANKSSGHPQLSIKLKTYKGKTQKIHLKLAEFNVKRFTVHTEQHKANRGLYPGIKKS